MRFWIVLLVSLLACSVGFHMYIWFFSVGYGLAIAAIGVALAVGFHSHMSLPEWLTCALLFVYGLRLGGYLLLREMKSAAYRKVLNPEMARSSKMPIFAKVSLWVACGVLYTLMTIPLYFRLKNGVPADAMLWVGLAVMTCGVVLEAVADLQKTAAKRKNSRRFVDTGLYRVVRCPNYLGELLLWLGMLLTGTTALRGPWQWIPALLGFILIAWVMFSGRTGITARIRRIRNTCEPCQSSYRLYRCTA